MALADYHAESAFGNSAVETLVGAGECVLSELASLVASAWQARDQGIAGHHHAAGVDAQPLLAVILKQPHQATVAQLDVLEQHGEVADVELDHEDTVDLAAWQVGQRQQEG